MPYINDRGEKTPYPDEPDFIGSDPRPESDPIPSIFDNQGDTISGGSGNVVTDMETGKAYIIPDNNPGAPIELTPGEMAGVVRQQAEGNRAAESQQKFLNRASAMSQAMSNQASLAKETSKTAGMLKANKIGAAMRAITSLLESMKGAQKASQVSSALSNQAKLAKQTQFDAKQTLQRQGLAKNYTKKLEGDIYSPVTKEVSAYKQPKPTDTREERLEIAKERWNKAYKPAATVAAENLVPGLYVGKHWNELTTAEKAIFIGIDVISIVPFFGAAVKGARTVGVAGKAARLRAVGAAIAGEAANQIIAPVNVILHPVATAKATGKTVLNLAENIAHPRKLAEAVITTSNGTVRLEASRFKTPAEAMAARNMLMEAAARGKKVFVEVGGQRIELAHSPLMREAGGGLVHATPDVELLKDATIVNKPGLPAKEQGWFLSHEAPVNFTQSSAFGKGQIPLSAGAGGKVETIAKYRPSEVVRLDKTPIRDLNLKDAKNIPGDIASPIMDYAKSHDAVLYGSFNEWIKVKGAVQPNDFDFVFRDSDKAIDEIIEIAKSKGYQTKKVPHGIAIKQGGEWVKLGDIVSYAEHEKMLPLPVITNRINGLKVETLGKQYIGQAFGAAAGDAKSATRAKKLEIASQSVKQMITDAGLQAKKKGIIIISPESARQSVSTDKLFHASAEMERKFVVGSNIPKISQKLFTRVGANSERVEIWLEKPLTARQIAKLKAEAIVEVFKAPFKEPIRFRTTGLTKGEMDELTKTLKASGNADAAENLLRAERLAETSRRVAPTLARTIGRVSAAAVAKARARIETEIVSQPVRTSVRTQATRTATAGGREPVKTSRNADELSKRDSNVTRESSPTRVEGEIRATGERESARTTGSAETRSSRPSTRTPEETRIASPGRFTPVNRIPPPPPDGPPRPPPPSSDRGRTPPPDDPPRRPPPPPPDGPPRPPPPPPPETGKGKIKGKGASPKLPTAEELKTAVAWKQGFGYWLIWDRNGKKASQFYYGQSPPAGVKTVTNGPKSAFQSVQTVSGKPPKTLKIDMGNRDVIIQSPSAAPGKPGAIRFISDRGNKTRNDVTLGRPNPKAQKMKIEKRGRVKIYRIPGSGATRNRPKGRMV